MPAGRSAVRHWRGSGQPASPADCVDRRPVGCRTAGGPITRARPHGGRHPRAGGHRRGPDCVPGAVRGSRPCGITTSGASRAGHRPSAIGHRPAAPAGAGWCCGPLPSITARNRPRRTAWCNSTPRHSSPRQRRPPEPTRRSSGTRRWAHRRTCVSTPSPASTPLQQRADLLREGQRAHSKTSIYPPALGRCATQCPLGRRYIGWRFALQFR